jgi:hypothetical protein
MAAKGVSAIQLLQKLTPTRKILGLCVVAASQKPQQQQPRQWHVGVALSDPYLSHAIAVTPPPHLLWATSSPPPVDAILALAKAECADAVVLGLPVEGTGDAEATARRDELLQHLVQSPHATVMVSVSDVAPATGAYVAEEYAKNILWDSLNVPDLQLLQHPASTASLAEGSAGGQACLHAGIALQMWLDEHCGGWANTFG